MKIKWTAAVGVALVSGMALRFSPVLADGIPQSNPLFYSGTLTTSNQPMNGTQNITINVWGNAAPISAEAPLCPPSVVATEVVNGRFRIPLDASCQSQISAHTDTWVEVVVAGASLGRSKVGAVPYAVETEHAVSASAAAGALADQIKLMQSQLHPASGFHAWTNIPASIPPNTGTAIVFEQVEFDLANEYDPSTGTFTPKDKGVYAVSCGIEFRTPTTNEWSVGIYKTKGNVELVNTDLTVDGSAVRVEANTTALLAPGDSVTCVAYHTSPAAAPLWIGTFRRNTFSVVRLY